MRGGVRVGGVALAVLIALGAGVVLGRALDVAEPTSAARWLAEWSRSAGFGGAAAIVAATIAYRAARASAGRQQWVDRKVQWWARAQWALDRALSADHRSQTAGLDMLEALGRSEWAGEHEQDLVDAAAAPALGPRAPVDGRSAEGGAGNGGRRAVPSAPDSNQEVSDEVGTQKGPVDDGHDHARDEQAVRAAGDDAGGVPARPAPGGPRRRGEGAGQHG